MPAREAAGVNGVSVFTSKYKILNEKMYINSIRRDSICEKKTVEKHSTWMKKYTFYTDPITNCLVRNFWLFLCL